MGHIRLGQLPNTVRWRKVVELLNLTDDPAAIAEATGRAAEKGLERAKRDQGLAEVLLVLIKAFQAAQGKDFAGDLTAIGMPVSEKASLLDVVAGFDAAVDRRLRQLGHRSDLAEMARQSAVDALMGVCRETTGGLFGSSVEQTHEALKRFSTTESFGHVGQNFFGRFLFRFLDYHLSRELPNHIGPRKQFADVRSCDEFKGALDRYCHEAARIVREFAGCWPSATEFREGVTAENVRTKFLPVAIRKLEDELSRRRSND